MPSEFPNLNDDFVKQFQDLQQELEQLRLAPRTDSGELEELRRRLAETMQALHQSQTDTTRLNAEIQSLNVQLGQSRDDCQAGKVQIEKLLNQIELLTTAVVSPAAGPPTGDAALTRQIDDLKNQLQLAIEKRNAWERNYSRKSAEVDELQKELEKLRKGRKS